jgi:hypothetical protein
MTIKKIVDEWARKFRKIDDEYNDVYYEWLDGETMEELKKSLHKFVEDEIEDLIIKIEDLIIKGHDVPKSDRGYNCHTCDVLEELKQRLLEGEKK